ncbi:MAG: hypothetical protein ABSC94_27310 [Polyangiaceae bacterium]
MRASGRSPDAGLLGALPSWPDDRCGPEGARAALGDRETKSGDRETKGREPSPTNVYEVGLDAMGRCRNERQEAACRRASGDYESSQRRFSMTDVDTHENHGHRHGPGCGHKALSHEGHTDYLHDGHLHHAEGDRVDEHAIAVTAANPSRCTPAHVCSGHDRAHQHGPQCGHERIPHGNHVDYVVGDHLHHAHGSHCDDHGVVG